MIPATPAGVDLDDVARTERQAIQTLDTTNKASSWTENVDSVLWS